MGVPRHLFGQGQSIVRFGASVARQRYRGTVGRRGNFHAQKIFIVLACSRCQLIEILDSTGRCNTLWLPEQWRYCK